MALRRGQGIDRHNAERVITEYGGDDGAGPLPAVSLRSGTGGRARSRASITWCDPGGLGVLGVWPELDGPLASEHIETPDVPHGVLRQLQSSVFWWRTVLEVAVSAKLLRHLVKTWP